MKGLTSFVNLRNELLKTKNSLKSILLHREQEAYRKWKEENPNDRSSLEKVVAIVKSNDEEWQRLEKEYERVSNELASINAHYEIVKGLVSNPNYSKEDVVDYIENVYEFIEKE